MNKTKLIWIGVIASISLVAFGTSRYSDFRSIPSEENGSCAQPYQALKVEKTYTDFYYRFGPRFDAITKAQIKNAKSMDDFLTEEEREQVIEYYSVTLVPIVNDVQLDTRPASDSGELSKEQLDMLRKMELQDHFTIKAKYDGKNKDALSDYKQFGPHFTVVPQQQAAYEPGEKALIDYLSEANKENTVDLDEAKLGHAILYFTITADGELTNTWLDRSCGSEKVEEGLIDLLKNAPGKWIPAVKEDGQKVDQELTIFFGINSGEGGC